MEGGRSSPSLRRMMKSSVGCFSGGGDNHNHYDETLGSANGSPRLLRSPSSLWRRSRAYELTELRGRCRNLISRLGHRHGCSRHQNSTGFSYDPLSYSLNFDEGSTDDDSVDGMTFRNFSARLPASLPPEKIQRPSIMAVSCR